MMTCECKHSDNKLSLEQQRHLNEAIATVDKVFCEARRKFLDTPEPKCTQLEITYINSVIALLVAVK